jgi:replicative DNA helicase
MADLDRKQIAADLVTVAGHLKKVGEMETVGGATYLAKISDQAPLAVNVQNYARIVKEAATRRNIIATARKTIDHCYTTADIEALLDQTQAEVLKIEYNGLGDRITPISTAIETRYSHWERISENPGVVSGIATGLDIDKITGGFQKTDLIVIAARPGMGKTALIMTSIGHMAAKNYGVGFFSLEMSLEQLVDRWAAMESRIDGFRFKTGYLKDQWEKINEVANKFYEWRVFIDDTEGLSYHEIRRRARKMVKVHGADIIFIDYLQLMSGDKSEGRTREIGSITRALKGMAKELNVPVVLLSQLSRAVENRPNKRPVLSDLRDSGEIEQDADMAIFIYRDEIYNKESPKKGTAEISVEKHRNGPVGMTRLSWIGKYMRFENMQK